MAVKVYKPITPGLRGMTGYTFEEITKSNPERSLIVLRRKFSWSQLLRADHRAPSWWWKSPVRPHRGFQTR